MNSTPSIDSYPGLRTSRGFTYVEMLIALAIAALIIAGLSGVVGQALQSQDAVSETNKITRDARFAMQRMLHTVAHTRKLMLPFNDNPNTNWPENIRDQSVPAVPPMGSSTLATAVLSVTLPAHVDLDGNGVADADNDEDGLIDEDPHGDNNRDGMAGIALIDDDGDGSVDEGVGYWDDDEEGSLWDEDPINGIDDDGDGSIDEDIFMDANLDGCDGICGVDDDADSQIDEGSSWDDDEDGASDEDWFDTVVFYLDNGALKERMPVPWDNNADSIVDGRDYSESVIAENVTRFRVERLDNGSTVEVIDLTLELTSPVTGEIISLQSQVRVGGAL